MIQTNLQSVTNLHSILMMMRTILKFSFLMLAAVLVCSSPAPVSGQSATATPESEEIIRLREQKTRAELEKDIAVAEKAKLEAQFPKPSTSPLAGETKIEGDLIESHMMSYVSMAESADRVVTALKDSQLPIKRLAIYSKTDADLLLNYRVTTNQIELVRKQYCRIIRHHEQCPENISLKIEGGSPKTFSLGPTVGAVLRSATIGGSLLGSFVDMTALLRTNVSVKGNAVGINESSLVSEIFRAARSPKGGLPGKPDLFYPAAFSPVVNPDTESAILAQLEGVYDLKSYTAGLIQSLDDNIKKTKKTSAKVEELEASVIEIQRMQKKHHDELTALARTQRIYGHRTPFGAQQRIEELRKLLADDSTNLYHAKKELAEKTASLASLETNQRDLLRRLANGFQATSVEDTVAKLRFLNERFEQFVAGLVKVDAATGMNSLTAFIKAENLKQALNDDGRSYWLQLAVVKAGGNNRIKTNLVADIFTGGNRISHSGGVIVQYNLYDLQGRSLVSDTLAHYSGYVKSDKIKKLVNTPQPGPVKERQDTEAKSTSGTRPTTVAKIN